MVFMSPALTAPKFDWAHTSATGELPEGMELIVDSMPLQIVRRKVLTESISGKAFRILRLTGIFQRGDVKNANGRVYPMEVLRKAVESIQEAIQARRVMGEFDHPPDAKIHMDRVSHLITNVWMDSKGVVYGEMEVLNDDRCPCGSMLACLIERKVQVGISSRGVGDMEMTMHEGEEAYAVQPGFNFVTFDAVAEPSVEGTHLMVMESRQRKNLAEKKAIAERNFMKEFHNFLYGS